MKKLSVLVTSGLIFVASCAFADLTGRYKVDAIGCQSLNMNDVVNIKAEAQKFLAAIEFPTKHSKSGIGFRTYLETMIGSTASGGGKHMGGGHKFETTAQYSANGDAFSYVVKELKSTVHDEDSVMNETQIIQFGKKLQVREHYGKGLGAPCELSEIP